MVKLFRFFLLVIFGSHLDPAMEPFYCLYVLLATQAENSACSVLKNSVSVASRILHPKNGKVQTTNFFTENEKKIIIFLICVLGYLGPKTHFKHRFFLLFFQKFFKIFKFQTPLAAKLCESPPQFFLILTQCIPYYQSGMVSMSRGRVDDDL